MIVFYLNDQQSIQKEVELNSKGKVKEIWKQETERQGEVGNRYASIQSVGFVWLSRAFLSNYSTSVFELRK